MHADATGGCEPAVATTRLADTEHNAPAATPTTVESLCSSNSPVSGDPPGDTKSSSGYYSTDDRIPQESQAPSEASGRPFSSELAAESSATFKRSVDGPNAASTASQNLPTPSPRGHCGDPESAAPSCPSSSLSTARDFVEGVASVPPLRPWKNVEPPHALLPDVDSATPECTMRTQAPHPTGNSIDDRATDMPSQATSTSALLRSPPLEEPRFGGWSMCSQEGPPLAVGTSESHYPSGLRQSSYPLHQHHHWGGPLHNAHGQSVYYERSPTSAGQMPLSVSQPFEGNSPHPSQAYPLHNSAPWLQRNGSPHSVGQGPSHSVLGHRSQLASGRSHLHEPPPSSPACICAEDGAILTSSAPSPPSRAAEREYGHGHDSHGSPPHYRLEVPVGLTEASKSSKLVPSPILSGTSSPSLRPPQPVEYAEERTAAVGSREQSSSAWKMAPQMRKMACSALLSEAGEDHQRDVVTAESPLQSVSRADVDLSVAGVVAKHPVLATAQPCRGVPFALAVPGDDMGPIHAAPTVAMGLAHRAPRAVDVPEDDPMTVAERRQLANSLSAVGDPARYLSHSSTPMMTPKCPISCGDDVFLTQTSACSISRGPAETISPSSRDAAFAAVGRGVDSKGSEAHARATEFIGEALPSVCSLRGSPQMPYFFQRQQSGNVARHAGSPVDGTAAGSARGCHDSGGSRVRNQPRTGPRSIGGIQRVTSIVGTDNVLQISSMGPSASVMGSQKSLKSFRSVCSHLHSPFCPNDCFDALLAVALAEVRQEDAVPRQCEPVTEGCGVLPTCHSAVDAPAMPREITKRRRSRRQRRTHSAYGGSLGVETPQLMELWQRLPYLTQLLKAYRCQLLAAVGEEELLTMEQDLLIRLQKQGSGCKQPFDEEMQLLEAQRTRAMSVRRRGTVAYDEYRLDPFQTAWEEPYNTCGAAARAGSLPSPGKSQFSALGSRTPTPTGKPLQLETTSQVGSNGTIFSALDHEHGRGGSEQGSQELAQLSLWSSFASSASFSFYGGQSHPAKSRNSHLYGGDTLDSDTSLVLCTDCAVQTDEVEGLPSLWPKKDVIQGIQEPSTGAPSHLRAMLVDAKDLMLANGFFTTRPLQLGFVPPLGQAPSSEPATRLATAPSEEAKQQPTQESGDMPKTLELPQMGEISLLPTAVPHAPGDTSDQVPSSSASLKVGNAPEPEEVSSAPAGQVTNAASAGTGPRLWQPQPRERSSGRFPCDVPQRRAAQPPSQRCPKGPPPSYYLTEGSVFRPRSSNDSVHTPMRAKTLTPLQGYGSGLGPRSPAGIFIPSHSKWRCSPLSISEPSAPAETQLVVSPTAPLPVLATASGLQPHHESYEHYAATSCRVAPAAPPHEVTRHSGACSLQLPVYHAASGRNSCQSFRGRVGDDTDECRADSLDSTSIVTAQHALSSETRFLAATHGGGSQCVRYLSQLNDMSSESIAAMTTPKMACSSPRVKITVIGKEQRHMGFPLTFPISGADGALANLINPSADSRSSHLASQVNQSAEVDNSNCNVSVSNSPNAGLSHKRCDAAVTAQAALRWSHSPYSPSGSVVHTQGIPLSVTPVLHCRAAPEQQTSTPTDGTTPIAVGDSGALPTFNASDPRRLIGRGQAPHQAHRLSAPAAL